MTPLLFVSVAVAGGLGAASRLLLDGLIRARTRGSGLPWGTIAINLSGSLLLGVLLGLAAGLWVSPEWMQILGVGFLGGYTTFSTASFETVRLLQERRRGAALFNGIGVLVAAAAAAGLGYWLGILLATGG